MFVNPDFAHRLELAYAGRAVQYARARQVLEPEVKTTVEAYGGGQLVYAGAGAPVNRAIGLGFLGLFNETDLAYVETFFSNRGCVPRLDLCPLASSSLREMLNTSGYRVEQFYSVLFQPIAPDQPALPGRVSVAQASPQEADLWLNTVAEGFSGQEQATPGSIDLIAPTFFSQTAQCFLAYLDSDPAGGGALIVEGDIAELCSASTRPGLRMRGVQTALLHARLAAAARAGCAWAMSVTSPGGASQRNLERSGFQLAYTKSVMAAVDPRPAP